MNEKENKNVELSDEELEQVNGGEGISTFISSVTPVLQSLFDDDEEGEFMCVNSSCSLFLQTVDSSLDCCPECGQPLGKKLM